MIRHVDSLRPLQPLRARRWDVVVLGSALPGLVAATRIAMGKLRVLLVQEEAATELPPSLSDPFFLPAHRDGPVESCLRGLGLPLIDRRRLRPEPVALQVLLPAIRADIGRASVTADELTAWGLLKPEAAQRFVGALLDASARGRKRLLGAPLIGGGGGFREFARGVVRHRSAAAEDALTPFLKISPGLRRWVEVQLRALSLNANHPPHALARGRLLGAVLDGGVCFATAEESITGLLRRRLQTLHVEMRNLSGPFELVSADAAPAIYCDEGSELWVGRALLLNAPVTALQSCLREVRGEEPDFLTEPPGAGRWIAVRMKVDRALVPEGMARRLLDASAGEGPGSVVRVAWNPHRDGSHAELVASGYLPEPIHPPQRAAYREQLVDRVRALFPFGSDRIEICPSPAQPRWDDAALVEDPVAGAEWPVDLTLRLLSKPAVYRLPREGAGPLGVEGECLLGWQAGEALLEDLL